ncbi:hypothetical protein F4809DRAFT_105368 [Biscogniauxia mediterranea]|nr:hypothetical protein F4809DRAFT_105368 [Biscogniauxia mediterranea]
MWPCSSPQVSGGARRRGQTTRATHASSPAPSPAAHHHHHPHSPNGNSSSSSSTDNRAHPTPATSKPQLKSALQAGGPALEAFDILSHPRLQEATGMLPRKVGWWEGVEPPRDELRRLRWAMSLPDAYPRKKPKGNF